MNTNTNTIRVTKAQKYNAAIALLEGKEPVVLPGKDDKAGVTMDAAYLTEFFKAELALLAKKNTTSSGNKKLTKAQQENEGYKANILAFMSANPNRLMTATDVMNEVLVPAYPKVTWSNQKAAALLNAMADKFDKDTGELVSAGKLDRVEGKGKAKTTFQIKPEYVAEVEDSEGE